VRQQQAGRAEILGFELGQVTNGREWTRMDANGHTSPNPTTFTGEELQVKFPEASV
jgi:hypothetical protein